MLLPTPAVARRAAETRPRARLRHGLVRRGRPARAARRPGCAERAGIRRAVALTHGHEVGWAALPGARAAAAPDRPGRRRGHLPGRVHPRAGWPGRSDGLTELQPAGPRRGRRRRTTRGRRRARSGPGYGLADRPVVVCVSRLVPRKGQDTLIRALPAIRRRVPDAALLIVGGGPYRATLESLARQTGVERDVVFTGSVPWAELPAHYAAGDVYAMPCRTRNRRPGRRGPRHRLPGGLARPGCRWWPATPAARRTRSARARPATWSAAGTSPSSPTGWPRCSPTGTWPASWARPAGPGSSRSGAGRPRPHRMATLLAG